MAEMPVVTRHQTTGATETVSVAEFPACVSWNLFLDFCVCRTDVKCIPVSHQSWNIFLVWNFGMEDLVELQLDYFDTINCQLLPERESQGGALTGLGIGGQAELMTAWA